MIRYQTICKHLLGSRYIKTIRTKLNLLFYCSPRLIMSRQVKILNSNILRTRIRCKHFNNNNIEIRESNIRDIIISIEGKNNVLLIDNNCRLSNCKVRIFGDDIILSIGRRCRISNTEFWLEDSGSRIVVDADFSIESGHIAATEGRVIEIGKDCMFSNDIEIRCGDSHAIYSLEKRINCAADVKIGNHVWCGAHSRILKGVNIADGCVIGNSAIVTRSIYDANSVIVGIPAKIVKMGVIWTRTR